MQRPDGVPLRLGGRALRATLLPLLAFALALPIPSVAAAAAPPGAVTTSRNSEPALLRALEAPTTLVSSTTSLTGTPSTQLITVKARGTWAAVIAWQKATGGWRKMIVSRHGRVGSGGVVSGLIRRQLTGATPSGTFGLTESFGVDPNPGTRMPYRHVNGCDWWVQDTRSTHYNNRVNVCRRGHDFPLTERGKHGSEHLIRHTKSYGWAVVIDFNRPDPVHWRGSGIFLHVNGTRATTGCVSVPRWAMGAIMRWLEPSQHPQIRIA